jgi:3-oxoacyl-[acyl-carrier protein] reductase
VTDLDAALGAIRIPDLAGKAILVTGASTGIGAAVAVALGRQGAWVAVHYNASPEPAQAIADSIGRDGGTAVLVRGDMSQDGKSEEVVEEAARALGGLDGLINNAGGMLGRVPFAEMTDAHYERVMNLNARSVLAATRAAVPFLKRTRGFIINTTSIAARNGGAGGATLYAASKGFVSTITHGHAKEFAGFGIRVNAVSPGVITTPFHERYSTSEQLEAARKTVPMDRLGTAEECVGAYLFLASETLSSYVTGQVIEVNGGQLMP